MPAWQCLATGSRVQYQASSGAPVQVKHLRSVVPYRSSSQAQQEQAWAQAAPMQLDAAHTEGLRPAQQDLLPQPVLHEQVLYRCSLRAYCNQKTILRTPCRCCCDNELEYVVVAGSYSQKAGIE